MVCECKLLPENERPAVCPRLGIPPTGRTLELCSGECPAERPCTAEMAAKFVETLERGRPARVGIPSPPQSRVSAGAQPRPVSWARKAFNFGKALAQDLYQEVFGPPDEKGYRSQEEIDFILEHHCKACEKWLPSGECAECGCSLKRGQNFLNKLAWASQACPLGKWGPGRIPLPLAGGGPAGTPAGVAIGSWNLPRLVELQVRMIRDKCGQVPILIADDCSRADKRAELERIAGEYADVFLWSNERNLGHMLGDASALWKAVQWGHTRGLRVVAKLSQRFLITRDGWLQAAADELLAAGAAIASAPCIDSGIRLYVRSEACLLDVPMWIDSGAWRELMNRASLAPVAELHYHHVIQTMLGGRMHHWSLLSVDRYKESPGTVWHCVNLPEDYYTWAAKYGLQLDEDFHTNGAQWGHGFAAGYKQG